MRNLKGWALVVASAVLIAGIVLGQGASVGGGSTTATAPLTGSGTASSPLKVLEASAVDAGIVSVGTQTLGSGPKTLTDSLQGAAGDAGFPGYTFSGDTNTGIQSSAADTLTFVTGGIQRASINSSGNLVPAAANTYTLGDGTTGYTDAYVGRYRNQSSILVVDASGGFGGTSAGPTLGLAGKIPNGSAAIGVISTNGVALTTQGAKIHCFSADVGSTCAAGIGMAGELYTAFTDDSANAGNRTVNKPSGMSAVAAGASTVTITNSLVASTTRIFVTLLSNDATCLHARAAVPAAGSFTLTVGPANCTGNTTFQWFVVN